MQTQISVPFKAGGSLNPGSQAYDPSVYSESVRAFQFYRPQVVAGPKLSGKTTLVNAICEARRHDFSGATEIITCTVPEKPGGVDGSRLLDLIAERIGCEPKPDLDSVLREIGQQNGVYRMLFLKDTHNLCQNALLWLLRSVVDVNDRMEFGDNSPHVKLLIDGTHSIETMTGPNSDFPLPQFYAGEFSEKMQRQFVKRCLRDSATLTDGAYRLLWEETAGDKYLTQAICSALFSRTCTKGPSIRFGAKAIESQITHYVDSGVDGDQLKASILGDYYRLNRMFQRDLSVFGTAATLKEIGNYWDALSTSSRDLAYRSGIVRKVGDKSAIFRAPILQRVVDRADKRVADANSIISSIFDLDGVIDSDRNNAAALLERIIESAAGSTLLNLHVGSAKRINASELSVLANALYAGSYEAVWEWSLPDAQLDEEMYMIKYAREGLSRRRESEVALFKMKNLDSIDLDSLKL